MNGRGAMHSRNGPPVGAGAPAKTADPSAGDRLPALMMAGEKGTTTVLRGIYRHRRALF